MLENIKKIFLVSNLYPSKNQPHFGTFVKSSADNLQNQGILRISHKALIKGQGENATQKLFKYITLYIEIIVKGLVGHYDAILLHYLGLHTKPCLIIKKFRPSKKFIINLHGSDILSGGNRIAIQNYKLKALHSADLIICPSQYFATIIVSEIPELKQKLFISPSGGIDKTIFYRKPKTFKENEELLRIIYVGRIIQKKGWEILLKTLVLLKKDGLKFSLKIAGDGEDRKKLLSFINENNLKNEVEYLGGVPHEKLGDLFRESDLFVFPTLFWESLGLVALEAMLSGTPVIASKRGAIPNYIKDGVNGLLFTPGSSAELKEKIIAFKDLDIKNKLDLIENAYGTAFEYEKENVSLLLQKRILEFCI